MYTNAINDDSALIAARPKISNEFGVSSQRCNINLVVQYSDQRMAIGQITIFEDLTSNKSNRIVDRLKQLNLHIKFTYCTITEISLLAFLDE